MMIWFLRRFWKSISFRASYINENLSLWHSLPYPIGVCGSMGPAWNPLMKPFQIVWELGKHSYLCQVFFKWTRKLRVESDWLRRPVFNPVINVAQHFVQNLLQLRLVPHPTLTWKVISFGVTTCISCTKTVQSQRWIVEVYSVQRWVQLVRVHT